MSCKHIFLHIGDYGIITGAKYWELKAMEKGINMEGRLSQEMQEQLSSEFPENRKEQFIFFEEKLKNSEIKLQPNCFFFNSESSAIESIALGPHSELFSKLSYTPNIDLDFSKEKIFEMFDSSIRKLIEINGTSLFDFVINYAMIGQTSSYIVEKFRNWKEENFEKKSVLSLPLFPDINTAPKHKLETFYKSLVSLNRCDYEIPIIYQNSQFSKIYKSIFKTETEPSVADLNYLIATNMNGVTQGMNSEQ